MPTRIVIRGPPAVEESSLNSELHRIGDGDSSSSAEQDDSTISDLPSSPKRRSKTPIRGVVGFRSSCQETRETSGDGNMRLSRDLHLSRDDLRSSPRLQGYLYMLVASIVNVASAVRLYSERGGRDIDNADFYIISGMCM